MLILCSTRLIRLLVAFSRILHIPKALLVKSRFLSIKLLVLLRKL